MFGGETVFVLKHVFPIFERNLYSERLKQDKMLKVDREVSSVPISIKKEPEEMRTAKSLSLSYLPRGKPSPPPQDAKKEFFRNSTESVPELKLECNSPPMPTILNRRRGTVALVNNKKQQLARLIDFDQFVATMVMLTSGSSDEQLNSCFFGMDDEKHGYITLNDFEGALEMLFDTLSHLGIEPPASDFVENMWQLLDNKTLGRVTRSEFVERVPMIYYDFLGCGKYVVKRDKIIPTFGLGVPVIFGENFNESLAIMIGLQRVSEMTKLIHRDASPDDFVTETSLSIRGKKFSYVEYCPHLFKKIRASYNISEDEYLMSIGFEQFLLNLFFGKLTCYWEQPTPGRSGAWFFFTYDGKFMIKSIPNREAVSFKRAFPDYYSYLMRNPNTLIIKYFGCFELNGENFLIMRNVFASPLTMHEIYDLKGSTFARTNPNGRVKKDNDFKTQIDFGSPEKTRGFLKSAMQDIDFLNDLKFIDYSLLVGIHHLEKGTDLTKINLGDAIVSDSGKFVYYIGIIDILTEWSLKKSAELRVKSLGNLTKAKEISAQPPDEYSDRLKKFILAKVVKSYEK